jgi:hypothetical protein
VHQLVDHWAWYLVVAGLPRGLATGMLLAYGGASTLVALLGLVLFARTVPVGVLRQIWPSRTRRSARPARRATARPHLMTRAASSATRRKDSR